MSKFTLVLDSSQVAAFLECEMFWNLGSRQQLAPALAEPKDAMMMGTFGHYLLDIYYKAKARGETMNQAKEAALAFNPDIETCTCGHPIVQHGHAFGGSLETYCIEKECECKEITPRPFPLAVLQREQVKQRFIEYTYVYVNNDIQPLSPEHVEVGFSEPIYEDASKLYVLEGRLDMLGTLQGLSCVVDHKFQLRATQLYQKSIQFRNYAMITKKNMLVINYIRLTKGFTKDTLVRDLASFTPVEHQVWKQRLIHVYDKVAAAMQSDTYEQRWDSCAGKYGRPCPFTKICEQWDKGLIEAIKKQQYVKKEDWKPW